MAFQHIDCAQLEKISLFFILNARTIGYQKTFEDKPCFVV